MRGRAKQILGRGLTALARDNRPAFQSLREYLTFLEERQWLKRVEAPVSPELEITELCHRSIQHEGPALYFEHPADSPIPVVGNVYGTPQRIAAALGLGDLRALRGFGEQLKELQAPRIPDDLSSAVRVSQHSAISRTSIHCMIHILFARK